MGLRTRPQHRQVAVLGLQGLDQAFPDLTARQVKSGCTARHHHTKQRCMHVPGVPVQGREFVLACPGLGAALPCPQGCVAELGTVPAPQERIVAEPRGDDGEGIGHDEMT